MNEEAVRADEREQIGLMLEAWAESVRRSGAGTDWEAAYASGLRKAARLARGDDE